MSDIFWGPLMYGTKPKTEFQFNFSVDSNIYFRRKHIAKHILQEFNRKETKYLKSFLQINSNNELSKSILKILNNDIECSYFGKNK